MVRYELVILGGLDNPQARVELRLDAPALHSAGTLEVLGHGQRAGYVRHRVEAATDGEGRALGPRPSPAQLAYVMAGDTFRDRAQLLLDNGGLLPFPIGSTVVARFELMDAAGGLAWLLEQGLARFVACDWEAWGQQREAFTRLEAELERVRLLHGALWRDALVEAVVARWCERGAPEPEALLGERFRVGPTRPVLPALARALLDALEAGRGLEDPVQRAQQLAARLAAAWGLGLLSPNEVARRRPYAAERAEARAWHAVTLFAQACAHGARLSQSEDPDARGQGSAALRCAWASLLAARGERSLAQLELEAVRVLGRHGGMPLPDPSQAERLGPPWLRESLALLDDLDPVDVARSAPAIEALGRRFWTP
ncbi:MAG: hypothetical protein H6741_33300 [Alphaproteobacteria bacterium]|nr:hypothetical protein [Alphaproteobacteria bacterium]